MGTTFIGVSAVPPLLLALVAIGAIFLIVALTRAKLLGMNDGIKQRYSEWNERMGVL
jgi:hypothetical protein